MRNYYGKLLWEFSSASAEWHESKISEVEDELEPFMGKSLEETA